MRRVILRCEFYASQILLYPLCAALEQRMAHVETANKSLSSMDSVYVGIRTTRASS